MHISEREVNAHLDHKCPRLKDSRDGVAAKTSNINLRSFETTHTLNNNLHHNSPTLISDKNIRPQSTSKFKRGRSTNYTCDNNAFQHMMKKSAQASLNSVSIQQRFHLHDEYGKISWVSDNDSKDYGDCIQGSDVKWSATIILKKPKTIKLYSHGDQQQQGMERSIQLTVSSSVSSFSNANAVDESALQSSSISTTKDINSKLPRLVKRHSQLSISHLKSCLQKSIRRRAPLPAVRVAMELADKSWTDLIRRLPIIILEDSTLHPDFSLLVWLMIADSKGFVPSKELIVRVLQVVFEMASCPWQDSTIQESAHPVDCNDRSSDSDINSITLFSLASSSSAMCPSRQHEEQSTEITVIRAMLLRAQYGGMKCDVDMLHEFSKTWLLRFNGYHVIPTIPKLTSSSTEELNWNDIPTIIHAKTRQQSERLVTMSVFDSTAGIAALTTNDVCPAGIDFHCSQVVEHLLSRTHVYSCLCEKLKPELPPKSDINRDWIASKVKQCIWNYSSGVNRRRPLIDLKEKSDHDSVLKRLWDDVLSRPFDEYTKNFVKDRLRH